MSEMLEIYGKTGATGVIVALFIYMITNLISSQKDQTKDLDDVRQHLAKCETKIDNMQSILIKMLDRWNKSDDSSLRHRETMVGELHDLSDVMMEVKGSVSRINGRNQKGNAMSEWLSLSNLFYLLGLILATGLTLVASKYTNVVKELKDVAEKLEDAYADGELSKKEKEAIMKEVLDVVKSVVSLKWKIF